MKIYPLKDFSEYSSVSMIVDVSLSNTFTSFRRRSVLSRKFLEIVAGFFKQHGLEGYVQGSFLVSYRQLSDEDIIRFRLAISGSIVHFVDFVHSYEQIDDSLKTEYLGS